MKKEKTPKAVVEENWQLCLKYKRIFNSPEGQEILEDMKRIFGWYNSSATHGMTPTDVFLNEGMKSPIRHIEAQLRRKNEAEKDLPKEAQHG
jgi:hypothetical protein